MRASTTVPRLGSAAFPRLTSATSARAACDPCGPTSSGPARAHLRSFDSYHVLQATQPWSAARGKPLLSTEGSRGYQESPTLRRRRQWWHAAAACRAAVLPRATAARERRSTAATAAATSGVVRGAAATRDSSGGKRRSARCRGRCVRRSQTGHWMLQPGRRSFWRPGGAGSPSLTPRGRQAIKIARPDVDGGGSKRPAV